MCVNSGQIAMSGRSAELHGTAAFDAAYFGVVRGEGRAMIVLQNAIDAISLGAVYALAALGIGLIFSIMRLINFAHGELIMVGGFALYGLAGQPYLVMGWPRSWWSRSSPSAWSAWPSARCARPVRRRC